MKKSLVYNDNHKLYQVLKLHELMGTLVFWARFHKRVIARTVLCITVLRILRIISGKPFHEGRISFDIAECHRIDIIGVIFSLGHDLYV